MKLKPSEFFLLKEKNILSNKIINFDENSFENKIYNNSNYNICNFKDGLNPYMIKSKMFNDNNSSRINLNMNNNKSILTKKNNFNEDMNNIYNYNNKLTSKNISFIGVPKKQSKLVLFEQNKNFGLFNNPNINKEKKILKNKSLLNNIKEISESKNFNKKLNEKKKNISSSEPKIKYVSHSQKNYNEDNNSAIYVKYTRNLTNNNIINKNGNIIIKENSNKSIDEFPYLDEKFSSKTNINNSMPKNSRINIENIKNILNTNYDINIPKNNSFIYDSIITKNHNNNTKKKILSKTFLKIKNLKDINTETIIKSLSEKEKSYYILSRSNVLQLSERIIFSRATEKIKSLISTKEILRSNETFIKDKMKELEQQITNYNSFIESSFTPSKIAIISINLIIRDDKEDFINFIKNNENMKEKDKEYYNIYIGLLFILLGEKDIEKNDINILYDKLSKKGYIYFKDYFYEIFIAQKPGKELFEKIKMNKFIELFEKLPDLIKYQGDIKNCRFICLSYFLINEIYLYWIKVEEFINLKNKTHSYILCLKEKISNINNSSKI